MWAAVEWVEFEWVEFEWVEGVAAVARAEELGIVVVVVGAGVQIVVVFCLAPAGPRYSL